MNEQMPALVGAPVECGVRPAFAGNAPKTNAEFFADQAAQPAYHRPHVVPLEPSEILRMAEPYWYCKERTRGFDAVGFAKAVCREYGISTYERA